MNDQLIIFLVISSTSLVQSLFGVGVLLFGTPTLLLLKFNFFDVLNILLPISLAINMLQISNNFKDINKIAARDLVTIVLPIIAITLTLASDIIVDFSMAVGVFLIVISLSNFISFNLSSIIQGKLYLVLMAIIHGITNLGGSLLAGYFSIKNWDKTKTRTNIAFFYFAFAATQLITLHLNAKFIPQKNSYLYITLGVTIFYLTNKIIFQKINESLFSKLISLILFIFGFMLIIKFYL